VLTAAATAKKPTHVSFDDAATLTVAAATAYDGVSQLGLAEGATLLINGIGGGVGVAAAQIARDAGLAVIGTASEGKRALVEMLGATLVPYGDGVEQRVRELMPDGVDGVLDLVGGASLSAVAPLAKVPAKVVSTADPTTVSTLGGAPVQRDGTAVVLDKVAAMVADGKLDPHVSDVVPFDEVAQAIASVEGGHPVGKIVVKVS
jgi:NADPH:quinone reductase-like Zn-dependent oxidoreductase